MLIVQEQDIEIFHVQVTNLDHSVTIFLWYCLICSCKSHFTWHTHFRCEWV